jgi:hypothetical protein
MPESYKWVDGDQVPCPEWVSKAIIDRDIRHDGDGDAFVLTNDGPKKLIVGDYVMHDPAGGLYVVPARIYEALTGSPSADAKPYEPDQFTTMIEKQAAAGPPHSSAVAARSAKARDENADWEAQRKVAEHRNIPPHVGLSASRLPAGVDPYNAAHEGAHVGDEPTTGTSDT